MKDSTRRRFLRTGGVVSIAGLTGCSQITGGNGIKDTDGDGVIDSEDYAPRDPDVQDAEDVEEAGSDEQSEDGEQNEEEEQSEDSETDSLSNTTWDFEEQRADTGIPDGFESPYSAAQPLTYRDSQTRIGTQRITTERAYSGSQSYYVRESQGGNVIAIRPEEQPYDDPQTSDVSIALFRSNESGDGPDKDGTSGVWLHENPDEPCIGVQKKNNALQLHRPNNSNIDITSLRPDEWVQITIENIDTQNNTYTLSWSADSGSGSENVDMINSIEHGYTQTVIRIDAVGYADMLSIG